MPGSERILYFVRHGQYQPNDNGGALTALGCQQIARVARRLGEIPVASIRSSDLGRAVETGEILRAGLGLTRVPALPLLRELRPTAIPGIRVPLAQRADGKAAVDEIMRRFFRPTARTRHEVFACHGNLIRALACRVLGVRLTAWYRMGSHNGGVTRFAVRRDGVALLAYNDTGHLSPDLLTTN